MAIWSTSVWVRRATWTAGPPWVQQFFTQAVEVVGYVPEWVTTDGHDAYPRAIRETLGEAVMHRCSRYLNNRIEHDHRGGCPRAQHRYYPMRGFWSVVAASTFCTRRVPAFEEVRQFFRVCTTMRQHVPALSAQRQAFCLRWTALMDALLAA